MPMIMHTANTKPILKLSRLRIQVNGAKITRATSKKIHIGTSSPERNMVTDVNDLMKKASGLNVKLSVKKAVITSKTVL